MVYTTEASSMMMKKRIIRRYDQLIKLETFKERFEYLNLSGRVGVEVWGAERYLNQSFYKSTAWRRSRRDVIVRDTGMDLAHIDHEILDQIIVHHMTPITIDDIENGSPYLLDPQYLITTCLATHNDLHYGVYRPEMIVERRPNDHILW